MAELEQDETVEERRRRGRGALTNRSGRYEAGERALIDDGWGSLGELEALRTEVQEETARSIITTNASPDISFDQSINPYRGCEHGCIYCYARPTHAYMGLSPGLDFETRLFAKTNAIDLLRGELAHPRYRVSPIALGTNTDPYQPIERGYGLTRRILEVMDETSHPVTIVTKSALVLRDLDLLTSLARRGLAKVAISVTTLDAHLARRMEPRATTPAKRIAAIEALGRAGVPVGVMMAPIVPANNDSEIERVLKAAREAGASEAGYVLLRLPLEIKELFREWLAAELPDRAQRVISLMQSMHGGKDYVSDWGVRQRGTGPYASHIAQRFRLAMTRLGLNQRRHALRTDLFVRPGNGAAHQLKLL